MNSLAKTLIIIPVYNEEESIVKILNDIYKTNKLWDILVINDGSTDNSRKVIETSNLANLINLPCNIGIGGTVQTGFKYALNNDYDICVQVDGDGQHPVDRIQDLIEVIKQNNTDITIGSRFNKKNNGFKTTEFRRVGIKIFEWLSLLLINQRITDHTSGFRAYNKKAFSFLANHYPIDYPEPEVVVFLAKNGFKVKEVFVQMLKRNGGISSIPFSRGPYYMIKVVLAMTMAALRSKITN